MSQTTTAGPAAGPEPTDRPRSERANGHPVQAANGAPAANPGPTAGPVPGRSDGYPARAPYGTPAAGGHRPPAVYGAAGVPEAPTPVATRPEASSRGRARPPGGPAPTPPEPRIPPSPPEASGRGPGTAVPR